MWAHCWTLFLNAFFWMLFQTLFLSLRTSFWSFWAPILEHFGCFFLAFSYLGSFLKIVLPCRRELNIQGPGAIEIAQKTHKNYSWLWGCCGKPFFEEHIWFLWKSCSRMDTQLEPKLAMWVDGTTYFHPWVHKVAQVVPNGAQSGSKGAQRLPKWS